MNNISNAQCGISGDLFSGKRLSSKERDIRSRGNTVKAIELQIRSVWHLRFGGLRSTLGCSQVKNRTKSVSQAGYDLARWRTFEGEIWQKVDHVGTRWIHMDEQKFELDYTLMLHWWYLQLGKCPGSTDLGAGSKTPNMTPWNAK